MDKKINYQTLEPLVRIGKNGVTDSVAEEIKMQLEKRKIIKVKFLKSALDVKDKKTLFNELLQKTKADLVHKVGFIAVLAKPSKRTKMSL